MSQSKLGQSIDTEQYTDQQTNGLSKVRVKSMESFRVIKSSRKSSPNLKPQDPKSHKMKNLKSISPKRMSNARSNYRNKPLNVEQFNSVEKSKSPENKNFLQEGKSKIEEHNQVNLKFEKIAETSIILTNLQDKLKRKSSVSKLVSQANQAAEFSMENL